MQNKKTLITAMSLVVIGLFMGMAMIPAVSQALFQSEVSVDKSEDAKEVEKSSGCPLCGDAAYAVASSTDDSGDEDNCIECDEFAGYVALTIGIILYNNRYAIFSAAIKGFSALMYKIDYLIKNVDWEFAKEVAIGVAGIIVPPLTSALWKFVESGGLMSVMSVLNSLIEIGETLRDIIDKYGFTLEDLCESLGLGCPCDNDNPPTDESTILGDRSLSYM